MNLHRANAKMFHGEVKRGTKIRPRALTRRCPTNRTSQFAVSVDRGSFKEITGFSGADFLSAVQVSVRGGL